MAAASVVSLRDDLEVPSYLEASEPPEARGLRRDEVRLLVSDIGRDTIDHARFRDLPQILSPGDLLVVNTSGTRNAALPVTTGDGDPFELHVSTALPGGFWTVELRRPGPVASLPWRGGRAGLSLHLPGNARAALLASYPVRAGEASPSRLWLAAINSPGSMDEYLDQYGFPIRYSYVPDPWPLSMYQTVFVTEPGSAEMPSAGRPFTPELVTRLISHGIQIAPLLLHTGVASLEDHEPPYEEFYRVPHQTAERVNAARLAGHRVIAVGTTVVRALETVTDDRSTVHPGEGWTNLVVTPARPLRSVTSLITGLHEPCATHLAMLEALITARTPLGAAGSRMGRVRHLARAYGEALRAGYLWHEFGDAHLLL